jgi:hypothetical protein
LGCIFWSDYDELLTKFCAHFYSDRDEFDEEKEPDGMLLSGWTQASSVEKEDNKSIGNGGTTSNASQTVPAAEKNDEADNVLSGKKRKCLFLRVLLKIVFLIKLGKTRNWKWLMTMTTVSCWKGIRASTRKKSCNSPLLGLNLWGLDHPNFVPF